MPIYHNNVPIVVLVLMLITSLYLLVLEIFATLFSSFQVLSCITPKTFRFLFHRMMQFVASMIAAKSVVKWDLIEFSNHFAYCFLQDFMFIFCVYVVVIISSYLLSHYADLVIYYCEFSVLFM